MQPVQPPIRTIPPYLYQRKSKPLKHLRLISISHLHSILRHWQLRKRQVRIETSRLDKPQPRSRTRVTPQSRSRRPSPKAKRRSRANPFGRGDPSGRQHESQGAPKPTLIARITPGKKKEIEHAHRLLQTLLVHRHLDRDVREAVVDLRVRLRRHRAVEPAVLVELRDGAEHIRDVRDHLSV